MTEADTAPTDRPRSRRSVLAGAAGLAVATSGCVRQVRTVVNREDVDQLSVTIVTRPADGDREGIRLARAIADVLEAVGVDVAIDMRSNEEYLRAVLINHEFDLSVGVHPGGTDPDVLYEALHSRYAEESGWQNPFGYANMQVDELLEDQRRADGDEREAIVADLLETVAREQPFVPICVPEEHRFVRTDRFDGWGEAHPATRLGYLELEPGSDVERLRTAHTDARPSENLNPLTAEYRDDEPFLELVYDSLATERDGEIEPWLAEDWTYDDGTLRVRLREDCRFHDDEPVRAEDVAFTYRLLQDTELEDEEGTSPPPRYRGLAAAVDAIDVDDELELELELDAGEAVAERALTVPILPEHVWTERAESATVPGVRVAQGTTEAITTDNVPPIGSGPFRFESRTEREHLTLERFDDHFTRREDVALPEPPVEEFRVGIDPRSTSAIELVTGDDADVTSAPLETYVLDDVEPDPETAILESPSWRFYHLGFNARRAPFANPRFRRLVARLIDKAWIAEDVFDGYAAPTATPVTEEWTPAELAWDGQDPATPFFGTDGDLDVAAAVDAFEDAGFNYDDGTLRVRR
ncbi:ABC transporter substrate-binding protein [Natronococcus occultus]|uniref:Family 5 extracellular solute-binding protein n=1 Tax=Natronococcus occultus SP4 TaxID=694430 RepID=L0JV58_9EURY|nr:ABC transporter substrate-binding protein [Natronococcus occultus]AGB36892.1 family 5 extracellular solute-binding protein [Natronococcus occultus SP4]